ncbi:multiheme c-type cytochrome [candidate division KSB1 bacterium]
MRSIITFLAVFVIISLMTDIPCTSAQTGGGDCMTCHKKESPGLYNQWYESTHSKMRVTCIDCHGASRSDSDAYNHYDTYIATLVTPKDCGKCHPAETEQVSNSYHASAGKILDSNDAYLAHAAGGQPIAITGCESCHGSKVIIDPQSPNKLARESWPNSGIGRINPDGSLGSCNACHTRHSFSAKQARQPEACSKCHLGPDHPQKEVYEESKHGNAYYTNIEKMNLSSVSWVVGIDYFDAPTCATCHMSATQKQKVTHDVGERIAWTLRPIISKKKDNWEMKRGNMSDVCKACHGSVFAEGHFYQFDATVELYNEKFAKPANEIMTLIRSKNIMEGTASFSNKVEWTFWELWHHEGRRARHGVAMMGPDYAWWHGIYEVAQHFYFKFLPEALEYNDTDVNLYIENLLTTDDMHVWLRRPTEELKEEIRSGKMQEIYEKLFKKKN